VRRRVGKMFAKLWWDFHQVEDPKISAGMARPSNATLGTAHSRIRKAYGEIRQALFFIWFTTERIWNYELFLYVLLSSDVMFRRVCEETVSKPSPRVSTCMYLKFEIHGYFLFIFKYTNFTNTKQPVVLTAQEIDDA